MVPAPFAAYERRFLLRGPSLDFAGCAFRVRFFVGGLALFSSTMVMVIVLVPTARKNDAKVTFV